MGLGAGLTLLLCDPTTLSSEGVWTSNDNDSWKGMKGRGWRERMISSYNLS